jgi:hypothetical protein
MVPSLSAERAVALERQAVDRLEALEALVAGLPLRRAAGDQVARDGLEVGDRLQGVLVGGGLGDGDRVLVLGVGLGQDLGALGEHLLQLGLDLLGRADRVRDALGLEEREQRAVVLRDGVDGAVLERLDVALARADVGLRGHVDALGLQGAGVHVHEQLVLGEVRRAERDGAAAAAVAGGEGVVATSAAAGGERQTDREGRADQGQGTS